MTLRGRLVGRPADDLQDLMVKLACVDGVSNVKSDVQVIGGRKKAVSFSARRLTVEHAIPNRHELRPAEAEDIIVTPKEDKCALM